MRITFSALATWPANLARSFCGLGFQTLGVPVSRRLVALDDEDRVRHGLGLLLRRLGLVEQPLRVIEKGDPVALAGDGSRQLHELRGPPPKEWLTFGSSGDLSNPGQHGTLTLGIRIGAGTKRWPRSERDMSLITAEKPLPVSIRPAADQSYVEDLIARGLVSAFIGSMEESRYTPDRCEAMAREFRRLAQRLVDPENAAGIMRRARQLEAKAQQMRESSNLSS